MAWSQDAHRAERDFSGYPLATSPTTSYGHMSRDSRKAKMTCENASAGFAGDREERESVSETHRPVEPRDRRDRRRGRPQKVGHPSGSDRGCLCRNPHGRRVSLRRRRLRSPVGALSARTRRRNGNRGFPPTPRPILPPEDEVFRRVSDGATGDRARSHGEGRSTPDRRLDFGDTGSFGDRLLSRSARGLLPLE
jgi:hypothetical protein